MPVTHGRPSKDSLLEDIAASPPTAPDCDTPELETKTVPAPTKKHSLVLSLC